MKELKTKLSKDDRRKMEVRKAKPDDSQRDKREKAEFHVCWHTQRRSASMFMTCTV